MRTNDLLRSQLRARILGVLGVASMALPYAGASCGGDKGGTGGASAGDTTSAGGGVASSSAAGISFIDGSMILDAAMPPVQQCFDLSSIQEAGMPTACPTDSKVIVAALTVPNCAMTTGWEAASVISGPTTNAMMQCCYVVELGLCGVAGRPYLVGDRARVASPPDGALSAGGNGWSEGDAPRLDGLSTEDRTRLAAAWGADALLEHASVASFSRFSLALLGGGAPADLVELASQAALDEIRHARLCFALATAYAGETVAPGRFPLEGRVDVATSLAEIAVSAVKEGCVGETIAAVLAAEQLAHATDPAVRAALTQIAEDEARHAELAWRTVAWALRVGGSEVHEAVTRAFSEALAESCATQVAAPAPITGAMQAHGRLDAAMAASLMASVRAEVVAPCARSLLLRHAPAIATA